MASRLRAAVLGATGIVGQRFIQLLHNHPWIELAYLAASERSTGKRYGEAATWVLEEPMPEDMAEMEVRPIDPEEMRREGVELVFSALPSSVAKEVEIELARRGFMVFSNASPMRLDPDIPLVNGEVNPDHLKLVETQRRRRGWSGVIVKNPNCSTAILTLPLKPLHDIYGVRRVLVATMQAVSGAGLRGVPSMVILDNLIPFIEGEEWKIENESRKILGRLEGDHVEPAGFEVYATTTRVPVLDGHTEVVYVELEKQPGDAEEVMRVLEGFRGLPQELGLPTAPPKPVVVRRERDRPQPRLDRLEGRGMSVVVGRVELKASRLLRMVLLGHNTIRGAAGAAILAAELYLKTQGLV